MFRFQVLETCFRAMGTEVHVAVVGCTNDALEFAQARIARLEQLWSRFIPSSEISKLNRANGAPCLVATETATLVHRAQVAWEITDGRFDPTVHAYMIANGYDRDFQAIDLKRPARNSQPTTHWYPNACGDIDVDTVLNMVRLPTKVGFDPGGIGKGLAADLLATELIAFGAAGACVNIGGDVRALGAAPTADGWIIAIENPAQPGENLAHVSLARGAAVMSSCVSRTWVQGGRPMHHLVDPANGAPLRSPWVGVAVVAGEAWWAEAWSKAIFVSGRPDLLSKSQGAAAFAVDQDGHCVATSDWENVCTYSPKSIASWRGMSHAQPELSLS